MWTCQVLRMLARSAVAWNLAHAKIAENHRVQLPTRVHKPKLVPSLSCLDMTETCTAGHAFIAMACRARLLHDSYPSLSSPSWLVLMI